MGRRRRVGLVVVVAAIALTFAVVKVVRRDLLPSTTRSKAVATLGSPASRDPAAAQAEGGDSSPPGLEAERTPEPPPPPPREGMVRYHARLIRSDAKPHSYYFVEATPTGASEAQRIPPTKTGDVTIDAPAECRAIDFTSHGFVAVHHAITQREFERQDLGAIVFVQAARLDVEILHAPRHKEAWLDVSAFAKVEVKTGWGDQVGFGQDKLATPEGGAGTTFFVPSDTEIRFGMRGDGICFRRVIPSLPEGATPYLIDFAQLHSLRGRIVGIPTAFAKGTVLWFASILPDRDSLFPWMDAHVVPDEHGGFSFPIVPDGSFSLRLGLGDGRLREAGGARRDWWNLETIPPEQELVVEPIEPLLGLEIGPIEGARSEDRRCSVDFDGPERSFFTSVPDGDLGMARGLIRAASLDHSTRARISIGSDSGNCRQIVLPIDRVPHPRDQVVTIRLDQLKLPTASLTVSLNWLASRDWILYLIKAGERPYSTDSCIPSVRREHGLFSFTFSDLAAGAYDVYAGKGGGISHRLLAGIVLGEGESATIEAKLSDPPPLGGRVANWADIPTPLRPNRLVADQSSSDIVDGKFKIYALPPLPVKARFISAERYVGADSDIATLADGTLSVTYPVNEVEFFELATSVPAGDHVSAFVTKPSCPETIDPLFEAGCDRVGADSHGTISILRRRDAPVRGWIKEWTTGYDTRVIAWFSSDLPTGTIVPAGRYVDVRNGSESSTATVLLVPRKLGDWQPPRIPIFKVIAGLDRRLWLADGVEFLDVEFPGRPRERIPAASIGAQWAIEAR
jgi:hypothetical protein